MKAILLTLFTFIQLTTFGYASIQKHFEDFFYNEKISARFCGENISNFMKYLAENNFTDFDNIAIVSMTSPANPWGMYNVVAFQPRGSYSDARYDFHVFAVYKGQVYDFFFRNVPTILSLRDYLKEMYIPKNSYELNGNDFKVNKIGPLFTPAMALEELKKSHFKLMTTNYKAQYQVINMKLSFDELLEIFP